MSLNSFKDFVRTKPSLVEYVKKGQASWQNLYETFEMYGKDSSIWDNYLKTSPTYTIKDMFNTFKNIDVSEIQNSINSIQKGIHYIEDLVKTKEETLPIKISSYEARPLYKYFED